MRIYSKFRDYYDGLQSYAKEDNTTYIRKRETIEVKKKDLPYALKDIRTWKWNVYQFTVDVGAPLLVRNILFFCGKEYHFLTTEQYNEKTCKSQLLTFHSSGGVLSYCSLRYKQYAKEFKEYVARRLKNPRKTKRTGYWGGEYTWNLSFISKKYPQFLTEKEILNIHIENKSPIVLYSVEMNYNRIDKFIKVINPCLGEYQFMSTVNPWQCFQEIEMYIGGILCNVEDGDIQISDKDLIAQHGYNKFSFRKPKEK